MVIPTASQRHLASIVDALLQTQCFSSTVRLLDMGCGDAHLIAYLAKTLPGKHPDRVFEFYGFEVGDVGWHGDHYPAKRWHSLVSRHQGTRGTSE